VIDRPAFRPEHRCVAVPGHGVFLLSDGRKHVLRGRLYELVAPHIDGVASAGEIAERVGHDVSAAEVYFALERLERDGLIVPADQSLGTPEAAYWSAGGVSPQKASRRLSRARVQVSAAGGAAIADMKRALRQMGLRPSAASPTLDVVVTDDHLAPELSSQNRRALERGRPWVLVRPAGREIWLGPLFVPGETGCWECLAQRLRANREVEQFVLEKTGRTAGFAGAPASTPATRRAAAHLCAQAIAEWVVRGKASRLVGGVISIDPSSFETRAHRLVRRPQCPACGAPASPLDRPIAPITIESRPQPARGDTGHRGVSPHQTLRRFRHHVSPITGAVSRLARARMQGEGTAHVYFADDNHALRCPDVPSLRHGLRMLCAGKGTSSVQARASALCEALERTSGVFTGDEPRRRARFVDLGDSAIHPNTCMLFSEGQYATRESWNEDAGSLNRVPLPFDEGEAIEWSPVWSLSRGEARYLPTSFCYYNSADAGARRCVACSNGSAAGNTLEEAILQGFFELAERDAVAIWWYNRLRRPAVDLQSFGIEYTSSVSRWLASHERSLWVLDLTVDLGIPVFVALSHHVKGPPRIMFGFGAHLDARVALLRAVTELNQMLSWVLPPRGKHGEQTPSGLDSMAARWLSGASLASETYLLPDEGATPRGPSAFATRSGADLRDDILHCQSLVESRGLELLVLDQTRPDIGLPTAKVIVPGLRHFWARFAPGRLYDVPVSLGLRTTALPEEELNPIPIFI
jgi:bacteriocin biosynthesis cyclodehydratase domain-containing protein